MNSYRFDVEFIYPDDTEIDNYEELEKLRQQVSKYIYYKTEYDPIIESNIQKGKQKNQYHSKNINNSVRLCIRLIYPKPDIDTNFKPDILKEKMDNRFSNHQNYKRTEIINVIDI